MPISFFTILMLLIICVGIYSIANVSKNHPKHPIKFSLFSMFPIAITALFYRYSLILSKDYYIIIDIAKWSFIVSTILFFLSLFLTTLLMYKNGYMNDRSKRLVLMSIPWFMIATVGIIFLIYVYFAW